MIKKNCPVREDGRKINIQINHGSQKDYKMVAKRTLYIEFVKHRIKEAENKYKKYKNTLTSIMRICTK